MAIDEYPRVSIRIIINAIFFIFFSCSIPNIKTLMLVIIFIFITILASRKRRVLNELEL